jgi:hypothetical protein
MSEIWSLGSYERIAARFAFVELSESYRTEDGGVRAPRRYLLVLGRRK